MQVDAGVIAGCNAYVLRNDKVACPSRNECCVPLKLQRHRCQLFFAECFGKMDVDKDKVWYRTVWTGKNATLAQHPIGQPVEHDTLFRIYSMTKPIVYVFRRPWLSPRLIYLTWAAGRWRS